MRFNWEDFGRFLRIIFLRGVFEIRGLEAYRVDINGRVQHRNVTITGYFESVDVAERAMRRTFRNASARGLYVSLNPVDAKLLARSVNKFRIAGRDSSTGDRDIERRLWLFIDIDSVRPSGISATDEEKEAAASVALAAFEYLGGLGWPAPVMGDSGNGYHFFYRIDLPADDGGLVKAVLNALAGRFDTEAAKIDRSVFNAARIVKISGTESRKGDNTEERPHRMSGLMSVPETLAVVSEEQLRGVIGERTKPTDSPSIRTGGSRFDLEKFITANFPNAVAESWNGGTRWILDPCPFNLEHAGTSAAVLRTADGVIAFKCHHDGCVDKTWKELRQMFDSTSDASGYQARTKPLVSLTESCFKFHTPEKLAYVDIVESDHRETWPVRSQGFESWLRLRYWKNHRSAPDRQWLADAIGMIESMAQFEGETIPVSLRIAEHEDAIYLDLCDEAWRAVRVDAEGWSVVSDPPVRFRRTPGMLPLPEPTRGGSVDQLRQLMNIDEDTWVFVLAWLIGTFNPKGPYPVLVFTGPQGSTKSTRSRLIRGLIDPNVSALRSLPREERDLVIAANNSLLLCFDNVSFLKPWMSDAICRISTGGGFGTRELYKNTSEILFASQRPTILNGIEEFVTRGDLLDRSLIVELDPLPEELRRQEREIYAQYQSARPDILGALLDGVSAALRNRPNVSLEKLPRLADFATWVTAAEAALGLKEGTFLEAYARNQTEAKLLAVEASPIGVALLSHMSRRKFWMGTAADLLEEMTQLADIVEAPRSRGWPGSPQALSNALRRIMPNLPAVGLRVTFLKRMKNHRPIRIDRDVPPSADGTEPEFDERGHQIGGLSRWHPVLHPEAKVPDEINDADDAGDERSSVLSEKCTLHHGHKSNPCAVCGRPFDDHEELAVRPRLRSRSDG